MGDGTPSDRAVLDVERMRAWLLGPEVVDAEGRVWSWHCPSHAGHPYPEAGGLWLSWAARTLPPDDPRAVAVARWLAHELAGDRTGRDGISHAFDLGVVLRGCIDWCEASGASPNAAVVAGAARLCAAIEHRRAAWSTTTIPDRWSTRFGAHHLKLLFALAAIERMGICEVARAREVLARTFAYEHTPTSYLHAQLYALEGRAFGCATGAIRDDDLDEELASLATAQRASGGLPAWWSPEAGAWGPTRSDATAQAIRLWACRDRTRWSDAITRGLAFLARLAREAAVRYDDSSDDRNTWCTLFALQASAFADSPAVLADVL